MIFAGTALYTSLRRSVDGVQSSVLHVELIASAGRRCPSRLACYFHNCYTEVVLLFPVKKNKNDTPAHRI